MNVLSLHKVFQKTLITVVNWVSDYNGSYFVQASMCLAWTECAFGVSQPTQFFRTPVFSGHELAMPAMVALLMMVVHVHIYVYHIDAEWCVCKLGHHYLNQCGFIIDNSEEQTNEFLIKFFIQEYQYGNVVCTKLRMMGLAGEKPRPQLLSGYWDCNTVLAWCLDRFAKVTESS